MATAALRHIREHHGLLSLLISGHISYDRSGQSAGGAVPGNIQSISSLNGRYKCEGDIKGQLARRRALIKRADLAGLTKQVAAKLSPGTTKDPYAANPNFSYRRAPHH